MTAVVASTGLIKGEDSTDRRLVRRQRHGLALHAACREEPGRRSPRSFRSGAQAGPEGPFFVTVTAEDASPVGTVEVLKNGRTLGKSALERGSAKVQLKPLAKAGPTELEARYLGSDRLAPSRTTFTVEVVKGKRRS